MHQSHTPSFKSKLGSILEHPGEESKNNTLITNIEKNANIAISNHTQFKRLDPEQRLCFQVSRDSDGCFLNNSDLLELRVLHPSILSKDYMSCIKMYFQNMFGMMIKFEHRMSYTDNQIVNWMLVPLIPETVILLTSPMSDIRHIHLHRESQSDDNETSNSKTRKSKEKKEFKVFLLTIVIMSIIMAAGIYFFPKPG